MDIYIEFIVVKLVLNDFDLISLNEGRVLWVWG